MRGDYYPGFQFLAGAQAKNHRPAQTPGLVFNLFFVNKRHGFHYRVRGGQNSRPDTPITKQMRQNGLLYQLFQPFYGAFDIAAPGLPLGDYAIQRVERLITLGFKLFVHVFEAVYHMSLSAQLFFAVP